MLANSGNLNCLLLLLLAVVIKASQTCGRTDFYCYYIKEVHPNCSGEESHEIITRKRWRTALEEESDLGNNMASNGLYRPRSALARALYEKQRNDRHLQEFDKNEIRKYTNDCVDDLAKNLNCYDQSAFIVNCYNWYRVDKSRLDPELQSKFVQLHADEETKSFLSSSIEKSTWVWTQIWYLLAKAVLRHFWSITDINGWLGRGSMFVLSAAQAGALLQRDTAAGALVDVGAGDGEVSRRFAHLYQRQYATEISASMRKSLSAKGFTILDTEDWWREQRFECVCMLNLLDRCSKPRSMLREARTALAPDGVLMLALVLPYKPYVEVTADHKPEERLPIQGVTFEEQLASFVTFMSEEAGFELSAWARAPYLCEGDFAQAYYWLDDSVYVFRPKAIPSA